MTRMWTRRVDLYIVEPMLTGFRAAEGFSLFKDRMRLLPQAAADLKTLAQEKITWLDGLMAGVIHRRQVHAGRHPAVLHDRFRATVGQPINRDNANIAHGSTA